MLNALYNNINWNGISTVGFDMDGTLYDEYDFMYQVYGKINHQLINNDVALEFMLQRWLQKGSSYPYIFDETYEKFSNISLEKDIFIEKSLEVFRNFTPTLSLSERTKTILSYCQKNYELFLVSDGNPILQKKKYLSLGLSNYFKKENIIFTGEYSKEYHKPSNKALDYLEMDLSNSLFFGDRDKDETFALSSKMQFQKVYNMIEVQK